MQPKTRRLVTESNLESHTSSAIYPVQSQMDHLSSRTEALEAMGGLSPGDVTDAQTANLIQQGSSTTRVSLNAAISEAVYDVPAPTGEPGSDAAMVIAAADAARQEGRESVHLGPGHYQLDGVTVDDIFGRYLVGDGVTFTPESFVYPFKTSEIAARSVEAPKEGGRGAIAFEVDDADPSHWWSLFPITKELGVPFGLSWITKRENTAWVKEAARHGWEIMSHLPVDVNANEIPLQQLEDLAAESLDDLEWATGTRSGHGIVYPRHLRNDETDRVLSKYFARGRANSELTARPLDAPNPWRYQALDFSAHITGGRVSESMKNILDSIAASNSKAVFFTHWRDTPDREELDDGFRDLIAYARNLGISIRLPKQLTTRSQVIPDPYFQRDDWELSSSNVVFDDTVSYHGHRSLRVDSIGFAATRQFPLVTPPGCFTVARLSIRMKTDGATASSSSQGIRPTIQTYSSNEHGDQEISPRLTLPPIGPTPNIPAQDWDRHRETLILPPGINTAIMRIGGQNITDGVIWLDEFQLDIIDHIPEYVVEGRTNTQNATGTREYTVMSMSLDGLQYRIEPVDHFEGDLSAIIGVNTVDVRSTHEQDRDKRWRVIFSPHDDYTDREWSTEGA